MSKLIKTLIKDCLTFLAILGTCSPLILGIALLFLFDDALYFLLGVVGEGIIVWLIFRIGEYLGWDKP